MSNAAEKGKKLAQDFIAKRDKDIETVLNDPSSRQYALGEAAVSLMEDGFPVTKETLKSWLEKRIPTSTPGYDKMRWERLLAWSESLPTPKTS